ncbi:flagellar hook protein FliD [Pseudomonas sp. 21]|uniref:flagellar filament capping protein FliD n=1 Tax=unclassified Pseudomonas TaxID=196821 RepID=UPI0005EBA85B|nr:MULTISPECIES: flagellar filament capping protein FliD [unclassified Pseudomonas]KJJ98432.1 flagellar hook protein FliD [Pseudomonas sp. 21]MBV7584180.1 flagellar filament capping protein FliD [Pseudomonas sp. PDM33]
MATIDSDYVKSMAQQLATYEVQNGLNKADRNKSSYQSQLTAVTSLESALKTFSSAVKSLQGVTGSNTSMLVNSATTSKDGYLTAKVDKNAVPGSYDFFVEQLATSHQLSFSGLQSGDVDTQGTLTLTQNGKSFDIDLSKIDTDGDGSNSLDELAAAINKATDNTGVKATLVRSNGQVSLVLGAEKSGADNAISLSLSGTDSANSAFENAIGNPQELSKAQDARVRLGGENGMLLTNASNTFDNIIDGVSATFTQAQKSGEQAIRLTVAQDQSETKKKVQTFIDAFNALASTIDSLTAAGDQNGNARGALAGDSSVRSIENALNQMVRTSFGGANLITLGISADRSGKLTLDATRFEKAIASDPEALDKLFMGKGNLLDSLDKGVAVYTNSVNGVMKNRKDALNNSLRRVDDDYDNLQKQYDTYYARYLKQYTSMMQTMQSMDQTSGMFG